ncbi:MAG: mannonate dehydratase [Alphaproteobacteria bacterium]|nr:mannonate dehydratase [Alphaproteobacteria bacterium]
MENRRRFVTALGLAAAAPLAPAADAAPACKSALKPVKARIGHEMQGVLTDKAAGYLARFGVDGVGCAAQMADPTRVYATVEELKRARDLCERHKLTMDIAECALPTQNVDQQEHPAINLGEGPERDRDIEGFQIHIRNVAAAGIPCIKYALNLLGAMRSGTVQGRGDALYTVWKLADAPKDLPLTKAGVVPGDMFWERITYFLERVVPVAAEYKVKLALHPHDPGVPPSGYRGIQRVLGTVEGVKRFVAIHENPYHGLNFCQGTMSEMLQEPGKDIFDVIRYFGSRKKIFNVHFRNIRGKRDDFVETFPDEGDVDFVKAVKVYREVGYDGLLMPDHAPRFKDSPNGPNESYAFDFGYIRALLQAEAHII